MATILQVLSVLISAVCVYWLGIKSTKRRDLPPGPQPLPLFGNLFNEPKERPWLTYKKWARECGSDLISTLTLGHTTVVINSYRAAVNLLDKRSRWYSDRPYYAIDYLTGWDWNWGFAPYSEKWRLRRRTFNHYFHPTAIKKYRHIQTREVRSFLKRAIANPGRIDKDSVSRIFIATIWDINFGQQLGDHNNSLIELSQQAVHVLNLSRVGSFLVERIPALAYLPSWMPGSSAKRFGDLHKPVVEAARIGGYRAVVDGIKDGSVDPACVTHRLIQSLQSPQLTLSHEDEQLIIDVTGIGYVAAADTQSTAMSSFFIGMAFQPSAQRKAQTELDSVIGPGRLPTTEDIAALPRIQAVVLEVLRWMPVLPFSVPRRVMEEDDYLDHKIPKGSTVIPNTWAILHDPIDFPDPETFNPDRFILNGGINPRLQLIARTAFGFGRRLCPGRYLATETLSLAIASILYTFDIETSGPVIRPPNSTTGLFSYPEDIPCCLKLRHSAVRSLIDAETDG